MPRRGRNGVAGASAQRPRRVPRAFAHLGGAALLAAAPA